MAGFIMKGTFTTEKVFTEIDKNFRENRNVECMSQQEFCKEEMDAEKTYRESINRSFEMKVTTELKGIPGFIKKGMNAVDYARDMLQGRRTFFANTEEQQEGCRKIQEYKAAKEDIKNRVAFLIYAPLSGGGYAFENVERIRNEEYDDFIQRYPKLDGVHREQILFYYPQEPPNGQSLLEKAEAFMQKMGCNAVRVVIVFNGHGTTAGMNFENDETVTVPSFLEAMMNIINRNADMNPREVDIVLGQCYAHVGLQKVASEDDKTTIRCRDEKRSTNIVLFTRETEPETFSEGLINKDGELKWNHRELRVYADEVAAQEALVPKRATQPGEMSVTNVEDMETDM